jgi:protein TonB
MAVRGGLEGTVVLLAYVDETGVVVRAEVVHGIGLGCDEAAIAALVKTRFHPATQRDKPVKVRVKVPIRFRLQH